MKSGLTAEMAALASIKARRIPLRGDVIFAAISDEEDKSQGTQDLIAAGWRADGAVIPEPTNRSAVHGSDPTTGVDSILHAGWPLTSLEEYQHHLPVDEVVDPSSLNCSLIRGEEPSSYPTKCTVMI
ncbi:Peptidase M20 [Penicillium taxi]|uniref:Peptidase M20 n=1 Tax=Penicillium taxi TaxID=168475 RepID=UPI0025457488|nr:Peptidase M20 [Penicillium taxi]KAJ5895691.1 Peptidase M20 [Penicillium taxi]